MPNWRLALRFARVLHPSTSAMRYGHSSSFKKSFHITQQYHSRCFPHVFFLFILRISLISQQNDLSFTCTCGDGSTPDLTKYMNTIPYFICTATYGQCVKSHPDDLSGQRVCKTNQTKCLGTIDPLKSATTTSQIEQTSAAKPTGKPTVTPTTTSEPAATTTSNPASTLRIPGHSSMGIMVALFLAAFKFFI